MATACVHIDNAPGGIIGQLEQDLRLAFRLLRRRGRVSILVVLVLGLGIGATTAVFTLVDAVLVRPLPYAAPDRLVTIWQTRPEWRSQPMLSRQWDRVALSWEDFRALRTEATALKDVEIVYQAPAEQLNGAGEAAEVGVARASAGLLSLLGVHPPVGRWFTAEEEGPGGAPVAVISNLLWATRFGSDPAVGGRSLDLDGKRFTIVGVLPPDFRFGSVGPFATPGIFPDVWTPVGTASRDTVHHSFNHEAIARLAPGVTIADAQAQVDRVLRAGRDLARFGTRVLLRSDAETAVVHRPLVLLFSAVALLLLISCANAALLLLGDGAWRIREMAVRRALGATTLALGRQLVVEHLALGLVAGIVGIALAAAALRAVPAFLTVPLPHLVSLQIDPRIVVFAGGVAVLSAVLCGLGPLLALTRTTDDPLRSRAAGQGSVRAQRAALAMQTVLAMVLLSVGDMLAVSLLRESAVAPGFATAHRLTVTLDLP
ncbi:MAG TPA: ABC transporter permease, partial [Gemmatimonadales bacterium]|nr:ABC transporter permease [Gemmatimonadales bacterium]